MDKRILLINPPWQYKRLYTHGIYPPYGILLVGTQLRQAGFQVELLDANARDLADDQVREEVARYRPDAVGVTVFTDGFSFIESFGPWFKKEFPTTPLVLGGPLLSSAPEVMMAATRADAACINEAFHTAVPLFRALLGDGDGDPTQVPGVILRSRGGLLRHTGATPIWETMDTLPWPDWSLVDAELYLIGGNPHFRNPRRLPRYLSMITTLGCPFRCSFCQVPKLYEGVRMRSPGSVVDELLSYKERYRIESNYFRDDILFRPGSLSDAIAKSGLDIRWSCLLRADMMTDKVLSKMREAGCVEIRVGFESGDDGVLDQSNKKTTVDDNIKCVEAGRRNGIDVAGFLIVGLPGETEASLANTLRFVEQNRVRASVHFPIPLPSTPLCDEALAKGYVQDLADLMRRFSEPQLPGQVLQPPVVNFTSLPADVLVGWATKISEAARGDLPPPGLGVTEPGAGKPAAAVA